VKRIGRILIWVAVATLGAGALGKIALERGESQTFVQRNLWLNVSFPKHVALALNGGSALPLKGRCPVSVSVTPQQITQQAATTVSCH